MDIAADIHCAIETQPPSLVNLTAHYLAFPSHNPKTKASLDWAEALLYSSLLFFNDAVSTLVSDLAQPVHKGLNLQYVPSPSLPALAADFMQLRSGGMDFYTMCPSDIPNIVSSSCDDDSLSGQVGIVTYAGPWDPHGKSEPTLIAAGRKLSTILYYTILTDLGQSMPPGTNPLVAPDLLQGLSNGLWSFPPSPLDGFSYQFSPNDTSPEDLGVHPSVVSAEYLCLVPQSKPLSTQVLAVIIADVVLLSSIWTCFQLVVGFLTLRHPEMAYCRGCADNMEHAGDAEHLEQPTRNTSRSKSSKTSGVYTPIEQRHDMNMIELELADLDAGNAASHRSSKKQHTEQLTSTSNLAQRSDAFAPKIRNGELDVVELDRRGTGAQRARSGPLRGVSLRGHSTSFGTGLPRILVSGVDGSENIETAHETALI